MLCMLLRGLSTLYAGTITNYFADTTWRRAYLSEQSSSNAYVDCKHQLTHSFPNDAAFRPSSRKQVEPSNINSIAVCGAHAAAAATRARESEASKSNRASQLRFIHDAFLLLFIFIFVFCALPFRDVFVVFRGRSGVGADACGYLAARVAERRHRCGYRCRRGN